MGSGHHIEALLGRLQVLTAFTVKIRSKADIVITTPGGHPKDINPYQAQRRRYAGMPSATAV